ncbi:MAG: hypothetical protein JOZ47_02525 [Kutzneria sp.]|nr:hypothetical protein [Kutzneria sp.]
MGATEVVPGTVGALVLVGVVTVVGVSVVVVGVGVTELGVPVVVDVPGVDVGVWVGVDDRAGGSNSEPRVVPGSPDSELPRTRSIPATASMPTANTITLATTAAGHLRLAADPSRAGDGATSAENLTVSASSRAG